jgi:hypothetical protein
VLAGVVQQTDDVMVVEGIERKPARPADSDETGGPE